jgi:hypothetical protein
LGAETELPDPEPDPDPEPEEEAPAALSSDVMPWLIEINCCRLFTPTIWVMYVLGSVGCVGSWFFNSLTSSVRKSLAVMVEVSLSAELLLAALLPLLPLVALLALVPLLLLVPLVPLLPLLPVVLLLYLCAIVAATVFDDACSVAWLIGTGDVSMLSPAIAGCGAWPLTCLLCPSAVPGLFVASLIR